MKIRHCNVAARITAGVIVAVMLSSYCFTAAAQIKIWDRRFGGNDFDDLMATLATPDGAYLLGGHSSSPVGGDKSQPSIGETDFWVVKMDENGVRIWDRRYGGKDDDRMAAMLVTRKDRTLLGGWTESNDGADITEPNRGWSDYWIIQIDRHGNKIWDKRFGGDHNDHLLSMAPARDGGYLLGGSSYSGAGGDVSEPSRGSDDYWVVKINNAGTKLWDKRYGGSDSDLLTEILPLSDGGFLLAGLSASNISGEKSENCRGEFDYWIVRIDKDGNKLWDKTFGGDMFDLPTKLLQTYDGGFFIGGQSDSDISGDVTKPTRSPWFDDFWLVKIDAHGNKIWDQRYGGDHADGLRDIVTTSDGRYLLGGWSYSSVSGERSEPPRDWGDFWMLKIDASGTKIWDKTYGGDMYEAIYDITPMPGDKLLLAGTSQTDLNGDKTQHTRGGYDFWVIKFDPRSPRRFFPRDYTVFCSPLCPPFALDIRSVLFDGIASFSFRITLPSGKAVFNKSGHTANPELQKSVSFELESDTTMLVTWKNKKELSLPDEATLISASVKILDNTSSFEACVASVEAFDKKGNPIDISSGCGIISFKNSQGARVGNTSKSITSETTASLVIFPNPGTDIFNVTLPHAGDYKIAVRDAHGSIVNVSNVSVKEDSHIAQLDLQQAPQGVYLITVHDGYQTFVAKVVKK